MDNRFVLVETLDRYFDSSILENYQSIVLNIALQWGSSDSTRSLHYNAGSNVAVNLVCWDNSYQSHTFHFLSNLYNFCSMSDN